MTKEDYKKEYLKQQASMPKMVLVLVVILFVIFIFEKVVGIDFAPQLYAATMGPIMFTLGIAGIKQHYLAYKAEFIQYRKAKNSRTIVTKTGVKAKNAAIMYIIILLLFFILPGILFSGGILYLIFK